MRLLSRGFMDSVVRCLAIMGGVSLWFPAVSIITIGNVTGLQPTFLIFSVLAAIVLIVRHRIGRSMVVVVVAWVLCYSASTLFSLDRVQAFRGSVVYFSAILMAVAGSTLVYTAAVRDSVIGGYAIGGVVSSVYTIYQFISSSLGWQVDHLLLRNGGTFPLYIPSGQFGWRPYAFMPEPSYLAASLIMLALILTCRIGQNNGWHSKAALILSILATLSLQSLSLVITLPLSFLVSFVVVRDFRRGVYRILALLAAGVAIVIFIIASAPAEMTDRTVARFANFTQSDDSFTLRAELFRIAFVIFTEHPITGTGAFSSLDSYESLYTLPPRVYGRPGGVPSQVMAIAAEQGGLGVIALVLTYGLAWRSSRGRPMMRTLTVGVVIAASTLVGTVMIYSLWVFLGMALGSELRPPLRSQTSIRNLQAAYYAA